MRKCKPVMTCDSPLRRNPLTGCATVALCIREGATLIQSVEDILEAIRPIDARAVRTPTSSFASEPAAEPGAAERRQIESLLGPVPVPVDELIRQAMLPAATVQLVLLELELGGRLERHAGGRVSLI